MKVLLALITLSWLMKFSESADVNGGTGILAYFLKPNCPTNWQDLSYDASYQGRTIKGWSSTSAVGGTSGNAQVGNNVNSHVHPSWSRRMYFGDSKRTSCLGDCGAKMVDDGADFYMNQGNSNMEWKNGNIAGVALRLCRYYQGPTFNIPVGMVAFFHHSVVNCPAGFSDFSDAHGRFLVFGAWWKNMGSEVISPAGACTGDRDGVGWHTHNMPASTMGMKERKAAHILGCCGPRGADYYGERTLEGGTAANAHLEIPYIQLRACKSTTATGALGLPHEDAIFYFDGQNCPSLWREATTRGLGDWNVDYGNIAARIVYTMYGDSHQHGDTRPGELLYCATGGCGNGQGSHSHYYSGTFNFPAQGSCCSWDWGLTSWTDYRSYSWGFNTDGVGALFPYRVMRACTPQAPTKAPTNKPTLSPSVSSPSVSPTTSFPTRHPTFSPTVSIPTFSPTVRPSRTPTTSSPTVSPTTSKPSTSPTTSKPTNSPTPNPSGAPTPSPVWRDVCTEEDTSIFVNYDNYVIQAARCNSDCRSALYGTDDAAAASCIDKCKTLSLYTKLCRDCMSFWILSQDSHCRGPCLSSKYSEDCVTCTNTWCRQDFRICTGFAAADVTVGGGDGGVNRPNENEVDAGLVSGAALGSLFGLAAVVVLGRKFRDYRLQNAELTKEMEAQIFKGQIANNQLPPAQSSPAHTIFSLFKSSSQKSKKDETSRNSLVAASKDSFADNPLYLNEEEKIEESAVKGMVLRTRYSFHGTEQDELDVPAGTSLTAIERNDNWYVCKDERTGKYGLIPSSYVSAM